MRRLAAGESWSAFAVAVAVLPAVGATMVALAQRHGTSVDEIVTRELEDVACAHAEELVDAVPSLAIGLGAGM